MATDWRRLFDTAGVYWTDRGSNVRNGCIVIKCPFCNDDPSQHMLISENNSGYHCHRNPQRHKGKDHMRLLQAVLPGYSRRDISELLNNHATQFVPNYERPRREASDIEKQWAKFRPASESARCLAYLEQRRGFPDPDAVCRRYDLRFAPYGHWSGRLLIPISNDDGALASWTGRALYDSLEPRYDMLASAGHNLLYVPRAPRAICVVVEGPMDALKIVVGAHHLPIWSIATLGLGMDDDKILTIIERLGECNAVYLTFDKGVSPAIFYRLQEMLARFRPKVYATPLRFPAEFSDAGEMPVSAVSEWLAPLEKGEMPCDPNGIFPVSSHRARS